MNRKRRQTDDEIKMDAVTTQAKPNVYRSDKWPDLEKMAKESEDKRKHVPWIKWQLYALGVLGMENDPTPRPPGFFFNYQTALFYLTIVGAILGGFWWTYERGKQVGIEQGESNAVIKSLEERLEKTEKQAKQANDLILSITGESGPGHNKEPKK